MIVDPSRDNRRRANGDRSMHGRTRHATASHHDAALQVGRDVRLRQIVVGSLRDQTQRSIRFAPHAEDPLNQRGLGLDNDSLVRDDFDHPARQVREHLHGQRLAAKDDHPRDLRHRLDHPRDGRRHVRLKVPEEALRPRERLADLDSITLALEQRPHEIPRRDTQPLGQIHRRGVSWHHRPCHNIARCHRLPRRDQHVPRNRQHAPPPP